MKFLEIWNIRLYAIIYGYKRLFGSSRNFKYTFIYEHIRIKALLWNYLLFEICAYMRWYTFIYACLEVLEISNIRLYAFIYVLIRMYQIFEISNIRLYAFIYVFIRRNWIFWNLKYTLIYAYIRFFSVEHDWKIYAYIRISESGQQSKIE